MRIARTHQPLIGILRNAVLRIALVVRPREHHFAGPRETAQVVDVPVRLVVDDAFAQPDDAGDAQVFVQQDLHLTRVELRIAVRVQQALLGGEQRALAVDVNRTAFQHERRAIAVAAFDLQHLARDQVVLVPRKVEAVAQSAPGVEQPVDAAHGALVVHDERRTDVPHPRIVARHLHDADRVRQHRPRVHELRARNTDSDRLTGRDCRRHCGECGLRGLRATAPVAGPLGPQQPAAGMRLEFARHAKAVGGRCRRQRRGHSRDVSRRCGSGLRLRCGEPDYCARNRL